MKVPKEFFLLMQEPNGMLGVADDVTSALAQIESAHRLMIGALYRAGCLDIDKAFLARTEMVLSRMQGVKEEVAKVRDYLQKIAELPD